MALERLVLLLGMPAVQGAWRRPQRTLDPRRYRDSRLPKPHALRQMLNKTSHTSI